MLWHAGHALSDITSLASTRSRNPQQVGGGGACAEGDCLPYLPDKATPRVTMSVSAVHVPFFPHPTPSRPHPPPPPTRCRATGSRRAMAGGGRTGGRAACRWCQDPAPLSLASLRGSDHMGRQPQVPETHWCSAHSRGTLCRSRPVARWLHDYPVVLPSIHVRRDSRTMPLSDHNHRDARQQLTRAQQIARNCLLL